MNHFVLFIGALFFLTPSVSEEHDFHVSVAEVQLSKKTQKVEVSLRVFLDDLELALLSANQLDDLVGVDEVALIDMYIRDHFEIQINGNSYPVVLEEIIPSNPAVFCIFHMDGPSPATGDTIYIRNDVFMEMYDDQINMLNVRLDAKPRAYSLNVGERDHQFIAK